jgi:hypothetical protein
MIDLIIQGAEDSDRYEKLDLEKATAAPADIVIKGVLNLLDLHPSLAGPDILAFIRCVQSSESAFYSHLTSDVTDAPMATLSCHRAPGGSTTWAKYSLHAQEGRVRMAQLKRFIIHQL